MLPGTLAPRVGVGAIVVRRARHRAVTAMIGLIPVIVGIVFYERWLQLFPQIEFRTWMWSGADLKWYVVSAFTHQGAFSRSSSFFVDSATRTLCGEGIRCINAPGFLAILVAAYLLFALIVRLTGAAFAAALAATLWLLSVPVLDAFGWQATLGDRLAVLFGLATVHVALSVMRAVARRTTVKRIVLGNACVLVPTILAYNSKEISWLLLPSLVLLAFALTDRWEARVIVRNASVLVAPAAYALFRMIEKRSSRSANQGPQTASTSVAILRAMPSSMTPISRIASAQTRSPTRSRRLC